MVHLREHSCQIDQVPSWICHLRQKLPRLESWLIWVKGHITPLNQSQSWILRKGPDITELSHWSCLSIQKSISKHELLTFEKAIFIWDLVPFRRLWPHSSCLQSILIIAQLLDKRRPYLQIWSPGVQKLQRLEQTPTILAHQVSRYDARSSRLASHRVHKHTIVFRHSIFYKLEYVIGCFILLIKEYLVFWIKPLECLVLHADVHPLILYLPPSAVDYFRDFICNHELQIPGCKGVTDEEPIFDLDGTDHVVF